LRVFCLVYLSSGSDTAGNSDPVGVADVWTHGEAPQADSFLFLLLFFVVRWTMADVTESAESKQLIESLKGRMLVLKEHL